VIARLPDVAQRGFELLGVVQRDALADRIRRHGAGDLEIHNTISVPSAGICQPACSRRLRSGEPASKAGFELLICKNSFLSIARPARPSIAPSGPDIAICPMLWPVLLPRPARIISSSRQTVPSKNSSEAPASRDFSSSVTRAQAARKQKDLPDALSRMRRP